MHSLIVSVSYVAAIPTEISTAVSCEKLPVWTATYHNKLPKEQQTHTHNYAVLVEWPIVTLPFPSHCSPLKPHYVFVCMRVCAWVHACVCVFAPGLNGQWSVTDRQALTLRGPQCPQATLSSDRQKGRDFDWQREVILFFFLNKLAVYVPRLWIPLWRWEWQWGGSVFWGGDGGKGWKDEKDLRKTYRWWSGQCFDMENIAVKNVFIHELIYSLISLFR